MSTIEHPSFRVIDDFLDDDAWTAVWTRFQFLELLPVTRGAGAWKLDDGIPLGGQERVRAGREGIGGEGGDPLDLVVDALLAQPELYEGLVEPQWSKLSARPYVYPRGTGLSWHSDDSERYAGAFIYYAHPRWDAHWGGELLIAELGSPDPDAPEDEPSAAAEELPIMAYRFETESYSNALLDMGCGNFVMPRPNRLVLLGGAPHMVARVSPAAGHNVRASVSGFFLR